MVAQIGDSVSDHDVVAQTGPSEIAKRFSLVGKVALVTGSTRGLGYEIARAYAQAGADLVISSRKAEACGRVAEAIAHECGVRALAFPCHVGNWNEIEVLVDRVYRECGRCDVLVNNAGISPPYDALEHITEAEYDKVLAVNLKGPFRLSVLVASRMVEQGGGAIINIGSSAANLPTASEVPYAAAKAGLQSLTIGLSRTYGPTVRVNCIVAGPFSTDISNHWDMPEVLAKQKRDAALQRIGEPNEIAGAALYLASDSASYTTGAMLAVDGGYR